MLAGDLEKCGLFSNSQSGFRSSLSVADLFLGLVIGMGLLAL